MPNKIVLTLDFDLTDQDKHDLTYLISDALYEFRMVRKMPEYLDRQYQFGEYSGAFRARKMAEISRRNDLASRLHNAALTLKIE